ncbi:HTTM domain-containing protein [Streptomyces sp. NPDC059637]|uniref:HTTM domain-containing protein n=1 Tax=Streptomyces sp. NPDC059637 TaxID=3347752 RepID=UPI00367899CE
MSTDRAPVESPFAGLRTGLGRAFDRGLAAVTGSALAPYQAAVVRIGISLTWLLFLLREWPHRRELYGDTSPWRWEMAQRLIADNDAFTVLMWSDGRLWFEIVYAGAMLASLLLLLGWRTRTVSVLFMLGVLSLQNRSVFMGDGGDNVIHLMAIYLVLVRCGKVWSLDARRAARAAAARADGAGSDDAGGPQAGPGSDRGGVVLWAVTGTALAVGQLTGFAALSAGWAAVLWGLWLVHGLWWVVARRAAGEPRAVLDVFTNLAHNSAMLVIAAEVCLIYATAGWYKVQGSRWQDGTALHYPLNLEYFRPWPMLSDALGSSGLMVMVITYGTVIVQVAFPFTLLNRRVKNVLLAVMMIEHTAIAVICGLPFFSLAMIAADAVFLPTNFLRWLGDRASRLGRRLLPGRGRAADPDLDPGSGKDRGEESGKTAPAVPAQNTSPDSERVASG